MVAAAARRKWRLAKSGDTPGNIARAVYQLGEQQTLNLMALTILT